MQTLVAVGASGECAYGRSPWLTGLIVVATGSTIQCGRRSPGKASSHDERRSPAPSAVGANTGESGSVLSHGWLALTGVVWLGRVLSAIQFSATRDSEPSPGADRRVPAVVARGMKGGRKVPGESVGGLGGTDNDEVSDGIRGFFVKIPGSVTHLIPRSCVRTGKEAVLEVVEAYAQLIGASPSAVTIREHDFSVEFEAIREEFSVQGFHERVAADAADFVVPADVRTRDVEAYNGAGRSLVSLTGMVQTSRSGDRFNAERCDAVFPDDPEYDRLSSLARDGVVVDVPVDLELRNVPEAPRKLQVKLQQAYLKHAVKVWRKRDGVILPEEALSAEDRLASHYSAAHLTFKPGGSRFLMDCSNSESDQDLNTPEVKEAIIRRYGRVVHPTMQFMVTEWYEYAERHGVELRDCRLFKDDFSGAFTQMNVSPLSTRFLMLLVGAGLVLVYLSGLFGWAGFPMAYGVLSRAFERLFRRLLEIPVSLYVDDIIGFSLADRAGGDQRFIEAKCEETMGSGAVSYEKKVLPCVTGEVLGWRVCLYDETFAPGEKGTRKLIFAFWMVATGDRLPLVVFQMLASLAEHYSLGVPGMGPFTYPLHAMTARFGNNVDKRKYLRKIPSSAARLSIEMWRVVGLLLLQGNLNICRPLRCLVQSKQLERGGLVAYSDASPTGLGIAVYEGAALVGYMSYVFPFDAKGSAFQCAREYFGYMLAHFVVEWLLQELVLGQEVRWVNDNKAALCWADENKCNSPAAQYAFMVVTWKQLSSACKFVGVEHQAGILMGDIDGLSRGFPHSMDPLKEYVLEGGRMVVLNELFGFLDPSIVRNLDDHHMAFSAVVLLASRLSAAAKE